MHAHLRQSVIHFEKKVSQGARQGQVTVHPIELDKTAGRLDSFPFRRIIRLVIGGERQRSAAHTGDAAAVAGVAAPQSVAAHEHCHRRGAGHLVPEVFVLAHGSITLKKAFPYGGDDVAVFVLRAFDNVAVEVDGGVARHLGAAVS